MKTLSEKDVMVAILASVQYAFTQVVVPLLPFLLLSSFGFFALFLFRKEIEFKFLLAAQVLFLILAAVLTNFSIAIIFAYIGILIASIFSFRTFETRKTNFSTASSVVSSNLRWLDAFLAIGLFLTLYINFQTYENFILESNANLIEGLVPSTGDIVAFQSQLANLTADGLEQSVTTQYYQFPEATRTQCSAVYDAMIVGLDNYKDLVAKQAASQNGGQIASLTTSLPMVGQIIKIMPLTLAILLFSLLEFLRMFVSFGFGIGYSLAKRLT